MPARFVMDNLVNQKTFVVEVFKRLRILDFLSGRFYEYYCEEDNQEDDNRKSYQYVSAFFFFCFSFVVLFVGTSDFFFLFGVYLRSVTFLVFKSYRPAG